ncbi:ParB N-terminal domain-containing protein [Flavobacterium sp. NRK F7]|uniref:ParB N-terminal domain-containing protein n=1 Tax=Flavobacterium sp. NRK F7 TaxID=2954930 RepID=UPI0020901DA0|nr:ParB N-terminal domain-containing protein [Flavobacterium sp. NRK F7]MCO6163959.1 ParB/RepB/Spo0J family partition protein [Flavobacterium sp. NRK F7]
MLDKDYYSIENQIKRIEENKRIDSEKKKFKEMLKNLDFKLIPQWHLYKSDIDFEYLKSDCHISLCKGEAYSLYWVKRLELFRILDPSYSRVFVKEKIWKSHDEIKITRVLSNWESNRKLIPPVLIPDLTKKVFLIQDGKHRFAVSNFFEVEEIPIIVLNLDEEIFLKLVNKKYIKKIE